MRASFVALAVGVTLTAPCFYGLRAAERPQPRPQSANIGGDEGEPAEARREKAAEPRGSSRPNVILILTDDQGYGDLACHGNPVLKTPNLDRLHAQSVRLTDFHVSPMCTPTRGQLMTGRDALASGAYCVCSGRTFLRRSIPTMAEIFAGSGYRTGIFGKWHLGDNYPHRPMDRGFQEAVWHLGWGITSTPDYWNNDYFDDHFRHNDEVRQYPGYCTDVFFAEAQKWIQKCATQRQPFFLYLPLNAPHGPFYVPDRYKQPYKHLAPDVAGFFGMIANLDENVGKLDETIREAGLRDNTVLIFLTDNGGTGGISVYNAGMRGAKASLYEGGHRAVCFVRWPAGGLRPPGDVPDLTQVQDLLPTLVELCGLETDENARFDGLSLARLLRGERMPELADRHLVVQFGGLVESQPAKWDSAVMWNRWRLVYGRELYDLKTDPAQKEDVAAKHPDVVARLRSHYEQWWTGIAPGLEEYETIGIGAEQENPVALSSMDWLAPKLTPASQPFDIRLLGRTEVKEGSLPLGRPQPALNGPWMVTVERQGTYRIELRRWPKEAGAAITAGLPAYAGVDGTYPAGIALPVAKARLKIGRVDLSKPVSAGDTAATFRVDLPPGKAELRTWFYDAEGNELCGAFYVEAFCETPSVNATPPARQ